MGRSGRGKILNSIPFALQYTPPPISLIGSGWENRGMAVPQALCLPSAGTSSPSTRVSGHSCRDTVSPEPLDLVGRAWWWLHTWSRSVPHPLPRFQLLPASTLCTAPQNTWNGGLGTCYPGDPSSPRSNRKKERRKQEWGIANLALLQPGKWREGRKERSGGSWNRREPKSVLSSGTEPAARSCSSDTQCPAKPQAFNSIKAGQTSQVFLCVSACENPDVCGPQELRACVHACMHVDV